MRDQNFATDVLANLESDRAQVPCGVFVEEPEKPSIKESAIVSKDSTPVKEVLVITPDKTQVFIDFIVHQKLPNDKPTSE